MSLAIELICDVSTPIATGVFEDVLGQSEARTSLDFFINSHSIETPFPTLLFTGGHGLGKTYFAKLVAQALGRQYIEINCAEIRDASDFIKVIVGKVFHNQQPATILLDEAHYLSKELTTVLLSFLNPTKTNVNYYLYQGIQIKWDMSLINIIFATTDGYKIFKPLRNRCQEVYFYPYSDDDLYHIVKNYMGDVRLNCSKKDLALTCRGRARDAFVLSTNMKRYLDSNDIFEQSDLNSLKAILGIWPMGLKRAEVELLKAVNEHGPVSSSNLAIKLMVNEANIEEELEIRLRELGMIESTTRGRIITQSGKDYLKQYC